MMPPIRPGLTIVKTLTKASIYNWIIEKGQAIVAVFAASNVFNAVSID